MISKIFKKKIKGIQLKLFGWIIVILSLVINIGCTSSAKKTIPNHQKSQHIESETKKNIPNSDESDKSADDEDFDLLEEELDEKTIKIADPLEPVNFLMYCVNDKIYFWVLKPCVQTYKRTVPEPARIGISNFLQNLTTPVRFVNCHLQGKTKTADTELNRFLINTTQGILGFGDPAKDKHGLEPPGAEDLGQTLAVHKLGNGFYLVLPLLGPSTARDAAGKVGDLFLNPVFYLESTETSIGISAGKYINESSFHIGEYEAFKDAAVDPYIAMRQAYIQYRNKQIQQ